MRNTLGIFCSVALALYSTNAQANDQTYHCSGSGYIEENMPEKLEPTGPEWIEKISKGTVSVEGRITFQDKAEPIITMPEKLAQTTDPLVLIKENDDGDSLTGTIKTPKNELNLEFNRLSGIMVVKGQNAKWIGSCKK